MIVSIIVYGLDYNVIYYVRYHNHEPSRPVNPAAAASLTATAAGSVVGSFGDWDAGQGPASPFPHPRPLR